MARIKAIELPDGNTYEVGNKKIWYGTCATAAGTAAKVVSCEGFTTAELEEGTILLVTFSATNSGAVGSLTLNVNSTGAKKIQYINNGTLGNLTSAGYLKADTTYPFIYDGTHWLVIFNYNTTYSALSEADMQTGTATTARLITAQRLKQAVEYHAPVTSVNGSTGAVTISVPTKTSDLTNDSGFITGYTETDPVFSASAAAGISASDITNWNGKQAALVSGTNIKTINNNSLLGSGNISISGGMEAFRVTATYDSSEDEWSVDKTLAEIGTAIAAGKYVYLYDSDNCYNANISYYDSGLTAIAFTSTALGDIICQYLIVAESGNTKVYFDTRVVEEYSYATNSQRGLVRPWYYHSAASTGPTAGSNSTAVAVNTISTTAGKYYAVESDVNGRMFVNVPWETGTQVQIVRW